MKDNAYYKYMYSLAIFKVTLCSHNYMHYEYVYACVSQEYRDRQTGSELAGKMCPFQDCPDICVFKYNYY